MPDWNMNKIKLTIMFTCVKKKATKIKGLIYIIPLLTKSSSILFLTRSSYCIWKKYYKWNQFSFKGGSWQIFEQLTSLSWRLLNKDLFKASYPLVVTPLKKQFPFFVTFCYSWFHKKGTFSVHSFNEDYISIPERPGS